MARPDLRVRLFGRLLSRTSIARMDDQRLARAQQQWLGHNRATDLLFGPVAPGVVLDDATAAGAEGPLTIRT